MTDQNVHRYKERFCSKKKLTRINRLRDINNSEEDRESDDLSPDLSNDQSITDKKLYADFRTVDLKFMITQITNECLNCKFVLSLSDFVRETKSRLAYILYVKCKNCEFLNKICTSKSHLRNDTNEPKKIFDVNT